MKSLLFPLIAILTTNLLFAQAGNCLMAINKGGGQAGIFHEWCRFSEENGCYHLVKCFNISDTIDGLFLKFINETGEYLQFRSMI
ncbi:MAG: hypothetical protein PHS38_08900 [Bacteroidales bacterium]|jgi:hypothetical protein|nr:hypothetical protein [Bacteroidales bacterium]MDD3944818.1 hypothetical protein [Bacteroidales bacterium]MDD5715017.1 hypothetical protein [Bacteroidales bacterium]